MLIQERLSAKNIINKYGEEQLFQFILGYTPDPKKKYLSPSFLRSDDTQAGCFFKMDGSRIRFYDYAYSNRGLTIFDLTMKKYNCTFYEALKILDGAAISYQPVKGEKKSSKLKASYQIKIVRERWNDHNLQFWHKHGVDKELLIEHKVYSCSEVWTNKFRTDLMVKMETPDLTYAYVYDNDRVKLYMPYNKFKHFGNTGHADIFGLHKKTDVLIITSSPKDVLTCKGILGDAVSVICPNSETVHIDKEIMNEYKSLYDSIYFLYDNDKAGIKSAKLHCEQYGCIDIYTPVKKDISDLYLFNKEQATKWLKSHFIT